MKPLIQKLPDVWFDWYARFLPGSLGLTLYVLVEKQIPVELSGTYLVLLALLAYLIGHILQPISGFIVKQIEKTFKNEQKYESAKQKNAQSNEMIRKVSKAHAEASGMMSCFFAVIFTIFASSICNRTIITWLVILALYFLVASYERVYARNRKINDLGND